jgi:drug/metabolite transporter (DMT)-like permease
MKKIKLSNGVMLMIIASFIFAWMGAFVKNIGDDLNSVEVVFFRNVFGTLLLIISFIRKKPENKAKSIFWLMFRGFVGTISLYALFYNMANIGLGKSITYLMTSPLFVAIFSLLFLKEKISKTGWVMILLGFTGIVMVFQPGNFNLKTDILGIFNGVAAASAYTSVRKLRKYYDPRIIVFSFMGWGIILPLISFLLYYTFNLGKLDFMVAPFELPSLEQLFWLFLIGLSATIAQILMTKAYAEEKAGIVSAIGYFNIPFAILIGLFFGDGWPGLMAIAGTILIIFAGIIISLKRNA